MKDAPRLYCWLFFVLSLSVANVSADLHHPKHRPTPVELETWARHDNKLLVSYYAPEFTDIEHLDESYLVLSLSDNDNLNGRTLDRFVDDLMDSVSTNLNNWEPHDERWQEDPGWIIALASGETKQSKPKRRSITFYALQVGQDKARMLLVTSSDSRLDIAAQEQKDALRQLMYEQAEADFRHSQKWKDHFAKMEAERKAKEEEQRAKKEAVRLAKIKDRRIKLRWSAPNQGLNASEIETVVFHAHIGQGGNFTTWLLLEDGTAYMNPDIPPSDFNVSISREVEPERWHFWQGNETSGYQYRQSKDEQWQELSGRSIEPYGANSLQLLGENYVGRSDASRTFSETKTIELTAAGQFITTLTEKRSSVQMGFGNTYEKIENQNGEFTSRTNTASPLFGNKKGSSNERGAERSGNYLIDGYTIEFQPKSGNVRREFILVPQQKAVIVDGIFYAEPS